MAKKKTLEKIQLEMKDTLESIGCMEVVSASSRNGDVRFLCRVNDEELWLRILSEYLSEESEWYSFVGKKYFLNNGRLVFGWVLIFESEEIDAASQGIRKLILKASDTIQNNRVADAVEVGDGEVEVSLPVNVGFQEELQKRVRNIR